MSFGVLDALEDEGDEPEFEINLTEEKEEGPTDSQIANQKRIKGEITDFVLLNVGGKPANFSKVEAKRLWGNKWRVNLLTVDKKDNVNYTHSWFIHYQKDSISADPQTPLVKLYDSPKNKES